MDIKSLQADNRRCLSLENLLFIYFTGLEQWGSLAVFNSFWAQWLLHSRNCCFGQRAASRFASHWAFTQIVFVASNSCNSTKDFSTNCKKKKKNWHKVCVIGEGCPGMLSPDLDLAKSWGCCQCLEEAELGKVCGSWLCCRIWVSLDRTFSIQMASLPQRKNHPGSCYSCSHVCEQRFPSAGLNSFINAIPRKK